MSRGGSRSGLSVFRPFRLAVPEYPRRNSPSPHPARRTGRAERPHPALGQDFTPSPTTRRAHAPSAARTKIPVEVRQWIAPALATPASTTEGWIQECVEKTFGDKRQRGHDKA